MKKKHWLFSFLALVLVDIVVKFCTFRFIPKMTWFHTDFPFGGIGIFRNFQGISFSLNYVENTGAAWGMFAGHSEILVTVRCLVIAGLLFYALFVNIDPLRRIPFLFILSGAVGNVLDYLIYGHVIDLFHFVFGRYSFPVFNFADMLISSGVILLFLLSWVGKRKLSAKKVSRAA